MTTPPPPLLTSLCWNSSLHSNIQSLKIHDLVKALTHITNSTSRRRDEDVSRPFRGRNNLSDDWISAVAYERRRDGGKGRYYHIVYENGDVSDVEDDEEFADAIEAGYYEFTDEVLTDLDCDTEEEEEEFDDTKGQCHNRTLTLLPYVSLQHETSLRSLEDNEEDPWSLAFHQVFDGIKVPSCIRKAIESSEKKSLNLVLTHPKCLYHVGLDRSPERPGRLAAALEGLSQSKTMFEFRHCRAATDTDLLRFHSWPHVKRFHSACHEIRSGKRSRVRIDVDTALSEYSEEAVLRSSGASLDAVDAVLKQGKRRVFVCTRPPGHHSSPGSSDGFCVFNNVAVAATYAVEVHDLSRVAIVDFDVHHGNGTEDGLIDTESYLYISLHQSPFYPFTGVDDEDSNVLNIPLAGSTSVDTFFRVVRSRVLPLLSSYKPQLLFLSSGFDAHKDDPLADMSLQSSDYASLTKLLCDAVSSDIPIISCLEGGYRLSALRSSVKEHVRVLFSS